MEIESVNENYFRFLSHSLTSLPLHYEANFINKLQVSFFFSLLFSMNVYLKIFGMNEMNERTRKITSEREMYDNDL